LVIRSAHSPGLSVTSVIRHQSHTVTALVGSVGRRQSIAGLLVGPPGWFVARPGCQSSPPACLSPVVTVAARQSSLSLAFHIAHYYCSASRHFMVWSVSVCLSVGLAGFSSPSPFRQSPIIAHRHRRHHWSVFSRLAWLSVSYVGLVVVIGWFSVIIVVSWLSLSLSLVVGFRQFIIVCCCCLN
jgi:hypothetical protein